MDGYVVRFYEKPDGLYDYMQVWEGPRLIHELSSHTVRPADRWFMQVVEPGIEDVTGDGRRDFIVYEYTGGAHCCTLVHVYELAPAFRRVDTIAGWDSDPIFADLDGDGTVEVVLHDWTFAYWKTSFASSPAPRVVLQFDGEDDFYGPPPELWGVMLDLIYTGHWDVAIDFFNDAWYGAAPGKRAFLEEFLDRLRRSPHRNDIVAGLYGGKEPDAFAPGPRVQDREVTFADPALARVVREALKLPEGPITLGHAEQLHTLKSSFDYLVSLEGIEHLRALERLEIPYNKIQDITPLASLSNLRYLDLRDNHIDSVVPLANLTKPGGAVSKL